MHLLQLLGLMTGYCRLYLLNAAFNTEDCFYLKKLLSTLVFFQSVV